MNVLAHQIKNAKRGPFNRHPDWVIQAVKCVFDCSKGPVHLRVKATSEATGVSEQTVYSWASGRVETNPSTGERIRHEPWFEYPKPLKQPPSRKIKVPDDARDCLVLMAKILWSARKREKLCNTEK